MLAFAAFGIYAIAVVWLHSTNKSTWRLEQAGPLPIAASYLFYGTPLGGINGGLWDHIYNRVLMTNVDHEADADAFLIAASHRTIATKKADLPTSIDGSGFGYARFAIATLFLGPRTLSLVLGFIAVLGLSTGAFLLRFRDSRLLVVSVLFSALTLMLLTQFASQTVMTVRRSPVIGFSWSRASCR